MNALQRTAVALFITAVDKEGLPRDEADIKALSADCYRAAELLLAQAPTKGERTKRGGT